MSPGIESNRVENIRSNDRIETRGTLAEMRPSAAETPKKPAVTAVAAAAAGGGAAAVAAQFNRSKGIDGLSQLTRNAADYFFKTNVFVCSIFTHISNSFFDFFSFFLIFLFPFFQNERYKSAGTS